MLNLYAAMEHINYAKNVRLYLQMMINLKHDGLYGAWISLYLANQQTLGRSCTDLVIEHPMMRSVKSIGGLTERSEMIQFVRDLWVSTLHSCAAIEILMIWKKFIHGFKCLKPSTAKRKLQQQRGKAQIPIQWVGCKALRSGKLWWCRSCRIQNSRADRCGYHWSQSTKKSECA